MFFSFKASSDDFGGDGNESRRDNGGQGSKYRRERECVFDGQKQSGKQNGGGDEDPLAALFFAESGAKRNGSAETGDIGIPKVFHDKGGDLRNLIDGDKNGGNGRDGENGFYGFPFFLFFFPERGMIAEYAIGAMICGDVFGGGMEICRKNVFFSWKNLFIQDDLCYT